MIENMSTQDLRTKIDFLRDNMIHYASSKGFQNETTIAASQKLDEYLTEYQNRCHSTPIHTPSKKN